MKHIELSTDRKKYEDILLSIETVTDIHRKHWAVKRTRSQNEVTIRYILIHMLRKHIGWKLTHIAHRVGLGDHSSAIHAFRKIDDWMGSPKMYRRELELIEAIEENYGKRCSNPVSETV